MAQPPHPRLVHLPHLEPSHGLADAGGVRGLLIGVAGAGEHATTGHEDAGQVQPGGGHQHAGHDLVTAAQQHQAVQPVGPGNDLNAVGDVVTGRQHIVVAAVAARQSVATGDGAKLRRRASRPVDAVLYLPGHLVQNGMAGHHIGHGVGDADDGPVHVVIAVAAPLPDHLVGDPVQAGQRGYGVFHRDPLLKLKWAYSPIHANTNGQN